MKSSGEGRPSRVACEALAAATVFTERGHHDIGKRDMPAAGLGLWPLDSDAMLFGFFQALANFPVLAVEVEIAVAHRQKLATAGAGEEGRDSPRVHRAPRELRQLSGAGRLGLDPLTNRVIQVGNLAPHPQRRGLFLFRKLAVAANRSATASPTIPAKYGYLCVTLPLGMVAPLSARMLLPAEAIVPPAIVKLALLS